MATEKELVWNTTGNTDRSSRGDRRYRKSLCRFEREKWK